MEDREILEVAARRKSPDEIIPALADSPENRVHETRLPLSHRLLDVLDDRVRQRHRHEIPQVRHSGGPKKHRVHRRPVQTLDGRFQEGTDHLVPERSLP